MPTKLVNPMNETPAHASMPPARPRDLKGMTVGLMDISKPGGSVFLDRLEHLLKEQFQVRNVLRISKPTFAKPAPQDVIQQLLSADAVIEALAD
jgi:hypothetical protein